MMFPRFRFGTVVPNCLAAILTLGLSLAAAGADAIPRSVLDFRDTLAGAAGMSSGDPRLNDLIYLPIPGLYEAPSGASSPKDFLERIARNLKDADPIQLYDEGRDVAAHPRGDIDATLASAPVTIVVVPGVFGELIKTRAFEEVFSQPRSAYRDLWKSKLAAKPLSDHAYALSDMRDHELPLDKLIDVSSIDGRDGRAMVNLVLFDTPLMSLESMGDIAGRAAGFTRRFNKFCEIMGAPRNIVLVGYSRGTMVALEMLAAAGAAPQANPWLKNVKAMVSLGGVVYGSDLADDAVNSGNKNPAPASFREVALLQELESKLTEVGDASILKRYWIMHQNNLAWIQFVQGMIQASLPPLDPGALTNLVGDFARLRSFIDDNFKPSVTLDIRSVLASYFQIGFDNFRLDHPLQDYDMNIRRLKKLGQEAVTAVRQLSTPYRLDWWAHHVVPTDGIRYYSVTATMADDSASDAERSISVNPVTYNPELVDDHFLEKNYHELKAAFGMGINDSQVAAYKVRFWPEMSQLLNPSQKPMDTSYLGVLGVHHWGLALRVVNEANAARVREPYNPFPRAALLKALAATVILDGKARSE